MENTNEINLDIIDESLLKYDGEYFGKLVSDGILENKTGAEILRELISNFAKSDIVERYYQSKFGIDKRINKCEFSKNYIIDTLIKNEWVKLVDPTNVCIIDGIQIYPSWHDECDVYKLDNYYLCITENIIELIHSVPPLEFEKINIDDYNSMLELYNFLELYIPEIY